MKKITTLFVLLLFSVSAFAVTDGDKDKKDKKKDTEPSAVTESKMAVMKLTPENYKLFYVSPDNGKVKVRLYDEDGTCLFRKKVTSKDGFALPYNFENLEPGNYTFEVHNQDGSILRQVVSHEDIVENIELTSLEADLDRIEGSKKFELLVIKPNQHEVKIRIKNSDGVLVHQERVNFEQGFKRVYDLTELEGDTFTFEVINGEEVKRITTI